jgi:putative spermidine/putrescine transport system permease protein
LLPFWSSILVRTYAWTVLLQDTGVINSALKSLGLITESLPLMRNTLGVTIGMTQILLPFLVFPVYAVMQRIDPDLMPAAEGLGARPARAFWRAFFPLTLPGVASGCLLVFVLSLGFYITPALLGSPSNTMYSVLVADMVNVQLRFGVASALSVILLVVTLILLWVGTRVVRLGDILGYATADR